MQKSAILVALLGALAVTGNASAQSSVTIFGIVDTGFTRDGGSVASVSGLSTGNNASSRLGFRGTEDLGGGLKAGFWLEMGLQSDSGAGQTNSSLDNVAASTATNTLQFGRRATVSLLGNFGEIRLGRDFTPAYHNETISPFGTTSIGTDVLLQSNLLGQVQLRTSNGVHYLTPNTLGGFFAHVNYAFGEQASNLPLGTDNNGNYVGARVGYNQGPLLIALGYGKLDVHRATGLSNDRSVVSLTGAYDFGVVKLTGEYQRQSIDNTINGGFGNGGAASAGNDTDSDGFSIGAIVPVGAGLVKLAYSRIDIENGHGLNTEPRASKFALGYVHNLSKRTALYTSVARLKNSNGTVAGGTLTTAAARVAGVTGAVAGANTSSTGFEAGVRHSF